MSASPETPAIASLPLAPVVRAESLTKRFGDVVAVDDLSFDLAPGTITGLLHATAGGLILVAWAIALSVVGPPLAVRRDVT